MCYFLFFYFILYFLFSTFFKFLFLLCYLCLSLSSFVSFFFSSLPLLDVRSLLMFLFIFTSFIRSISYVISSFLTFCLGCVRLPRINGGRGNETRSVTATIEIRFYTRAFTLVNVYGCRIASRNCRSLSLRAKCSDSVRGWMVGAVSKAFCVLLPTMLK